MQASAWCGVVLCAAVGASLLPLAAERLSASVGGFAVMNCHLDFPFGNEIPYHLQWDKDGEVIYSWYSGEKEARVADRWGGRVRRVAWDDEARALSLGRGSINVSAVRETDAGLYRCLVTFPNRSPPLRNNGTFYYLDVDGGNLIVTPPMNVTVLEGDRAEMECAPKSVESSVQWYREGKPLSELPELTARTVMALNGSLILRHTTSTDVGEFQCRVSDPDGQQQSASAFLDVQYKAKVVYTPKERYLPHGKPASLDCHFSANPPLTNLRWEKDGFLFDPYNVPGVFYSRNGSLLFNQVDESHEGQYSCTPYNSLGTEGASPGVRVRVQRPPELVLRPHSLYLTRLGAALTLPCVPVAHPHHPPPVLFWARSDGRALPAGRHALDGGNLTLSEIQEEDRGEYVCTATNDAAAVTARTEVIIENAPPRAPFNLTAVPTATSIHLSWTPGDRGPDGEYTVWYRPRGAGEWRTMRLLSRGATSATLVDLNVGTTYELRVLAQDQLGDGLFSKPLFVTTLDADGYEGARAVTAFAVAETEEAPEESDEEFANTTSGEQEEVEDEEGEGDLPEGEIRVRVRLVDSGALVRWGRRGGMRDGACSVRWYEGDREVMALRTRRRYLLVTRVRAGAAYSVRVQCGATAGTARLTVPRYEHVRAVALAVAAAALLLAAAAIAFYYLRDRRLPTRRPSGPPPPKRRY